MQKTSRTDNYQYIVDNIVKRKKPCNIYIKGCLS